MQASVVSNWDLWANVCWQNCILNHCQVVVQYVGSCLGNNEFTLTTTISAVGGICRVSSRLIQLIHEASCSLFRRLYATWRVVWEAPPLKRDQSRDAGAFYSRANAAILGLLVSLAAEKAAWIRASLAWYWLGIRHLRMPPMVTVST